MLKNLTISRNDPLFYPVSEFHFQDRYPDRSQTIGRLAWRQRSATVYLSTVYLASPWLVDLNSPKFQEAARKKEGARETVGTCRMSQEPTRVAFLLGERDKIGFAGTRNIRCLLWGRI